jgi:hypothetical protein
MTCFSSFAGAVGFVVLARGVKSFVDGWFGLDGNSRCAPEAREERRAG